MFINKGIFKVCQTVLENYGDKKFDEIKHEFNSYYSDHENIYDLCRKAFWAILILHNFIKDLKGDKEYLTMLWDQIKETITPQLIINCLKREQELRYHELKRHSEQNLYFNYERELFGQKKKSCTIIEVGF